MQEKKQPDLEETKQQTMTSNEELVASINVLGSDYEEHKGSLLKDIKSLSKKSLIRILNDSIMYPLEENKDLVGDEEIGIASKIRAIQDIKGRMTINYLMIEGNQQKDKKDVTTEQD